MLYSEIWVPNTEKRHGVYRDAFDANQHHTDQGWCIDGVVWRQDVSFDVIAKSDVTEGSNADVNDGDRNRAKCQYVGYAAELTVL